MKGGAQVNNDKKKLYAISALFPALLLAALFVSVGNGKIIAACIMLPFAVIVCALIKKRRSVSINKKEVLLISIIAGVLSVIIVQMTGVVFEFYKNPYFVSKETLFTSVLPVAAVIVCSEIVRSVMLAQKNKLAKLSAFAICLIAELMTESVLRDIISFNRFMDLVGLTLFPAISANIYYNYVSERYGMLPNIAFRIITTLYIYFIPMATGMSDSLIACIKIILPIAMLALISSMFEKKKKNAVRKGKKLGTLATALTLAFVMSVAMLISCQFRFCALVIATESMTGEINKGDMIIYERYDGQSIEEGQVIVFQENESRIVHRVVEITNIGGEVRYYTKGDANEDRDDGYRLASDIVGLTDVKIAFIGYPSLWLREIIK